MPQNVLDIAGHLSEFRTLSIHLESRLDSSIARKVCRFSVPARDMTEQPDEISIMQMGPLMTATGTEDLSEELDLPSHCVRSRRIPEIYDAIRSLNNFLGVGQSTVVLSGG